MLNPNVRNLLNRGKFVMNGRQVSMNALHLKMDNQSLTSFVANGQELNKIHTNA